LQLNRFQTIPPSRQYAVPPPFTQGRLMTRKEQITMKDNEKKVNTTEEAKKEAKVEENGEKLTDEELSSVAAGAVWVPAHETEFKTDPDHTIVVF
ncbi:MAG: hypothetical protein KBT46_08610, partial [Ruminococcus sp.]|nr:hypothetical protein [Candidatus Copronaster equi]